MPRHGIWAAGRAVTCRLLNVRRSRCCACRAWGEMRSLGEIGRTPSTVSRELRRNAATRGGKLEYRASVAQWKADQVAKRPKTRSSSTTTVLRGYVQDRLVGQSCGAQTATVVGPEGSAWNGPEQAASRVTAVGCRGGARSRSPVDSALISPMMSRCGSATKRSTRRSTWKRAARCERELVVCLRTGRRCGLCCTQTTASQFTSRGVQPEDPRRRHRTIGWEGI